MQYDKDTEHQIHEKLEKTLFQRKPFIFLTESIDICLKAVNVVWETISNRPFLAGPFFI